MTKATCISRGNGTKKRIGFLCAFFLLLAAFRFPAAAEGWDEAIAAYAQIEVDGSAVWIKMSNVKRIDEKQ